MARNVASLTLLILFTFGSCMEMRETVERMVMVRTTGSDLQPAATGYIYKKESDGPASVVTMGESEVMEHLSKFYEKPQSYAAPIPAADGPFNAKENDENKEAPHASEAYVAPVVEKQEENEDDHNDGIANDDYKKAFEGYGSNFGDYKGFSDYLHGLGHFEDGVYHKHGAGKDYGLKGHHAYGDKGFKGFTKDHKYGKGDAGDYHKEKYTAYSVSSEGGNKKDYGAADGQRKDFKEGLGYKEGDHGHKSSLNKGEELNGYHNVFDKNEYKQDHDFFDGKAHEGDFHKYVKGDEHHESDAGGLKEGGSHDSGHDEDGFGKSHFVDKESDNGQDSAHSAEEGEESSHHNAGDFGTKGAKYHGKSYGFEIKH